MSSAIEFDHISKLYRLGTITTGTLRQDLKRWWTMRVLRHEDPWLRIGETNDRSHRGNSDIVCALNDISFQVEKGDVVGIIGKNGAGKSTLLKILSRITTPTSGTIRARGRIGSLLEVGTGFHPELTGRDNIYMNGAILGMSKSEIRRKMDAIIDFSGCERYIDTPVKRYSSGMMVRLGFAVAAHLDPEILVVDEVLAVGDAEFQKKAIGKMQEVSRGEGRTVLFVSHNMLSIQRLCHSGILLDCGRIVASGGVEEVINTYKRQTLDYAASTDLPERTDRQGNLALMVTDSWISYQDVRTDRAQVGGAFNLHVTLTRRSSHFINGKVHVSANICNMDEFKLLQFSTHWVGGPVTLRGNTATITFSMKRLNLSPGNYYVRYYIHDGVNLLDWIDRAYMFTVENGDFYGEGMIENSAALLTHFDVRIES